jgi:hypothetical protein
MEWNNESMVGKMDKIAEEKDMINFEKWAKNWQVWI